MITYPIGFGSHRANATVAHQDNHRSNILRFQLDKRLKYSKRHMDNGFEAVRLLKFPNYPLGDYSFSEPEGEGLSVVDFQNWGLLGTGE